MIVYSYSEARQKFALILDMAAKGDEIRIKRKNGQMFVVRFQPEASSPLDIEGMNLNISADEIVKFVREGRKKSL
jgi:antitoxin Phd